MRSDCYNIKLVGLGTAGLRLLGKLAAVGFPASHFVALDSDIEELQKCQLADRIQLGKTTRRGWGCRGNALEGVKCVRANINSIAEKLRGADLVILLAGTGGGIGGGGASPVAEIAGQEGALVVTISIQPFDLEYCQDSSFLAIERLKQVSDTLISISNQKIMDDMPGKCSVQECLEMSNIRALESLMGFGRLVRSDVSQTINFGDIHGLIKKNNGLGFMASVEMIGDFSGKTLVDSLQNHPFFGSDIDPARVTGMLVAITARGGIDERQVNEIEKSLAVEFPQAEKLSGVYQDKSMDSTIALTVMAMESNSVAINRTTDKNRTESNRLIEMTNKSPVIDSKGIQQQLPLVPVSKGCFDKSESNLHDGEDLDVPTFLRRNIILN